MNSAGEAIVRYIGNGADSASYDSYFSENGLRGEALSGSGTMFFSAVWYPDLTHPEQMIIRNCFQSVTLMFAGFYARRKENGRWKWLTGSGDWQEAGEQEMEKRLIADGERVDLLFADTKQAEDVCREIVLDAQWKDPETGAMAHCGYPMFRNPLMAHAFGGFEGKTYCNTKAALDAAVKDGHRYFEADLSLTTDGRLVLCHGWTRENCRHTGFKYSRTFRWMPYFRIRRMKVHGHPIMNAREFYRIVKAHPEYMFEIDFHNYSGTDAQDRIRELRKDFKNDENALNRLLIQAYSKEMYESIDQVYPFRVYQYIVGKNTDQIDEIITYCLDHGICALALRFHSARRGLIRKIRNAGLYQLAYSVTSDTETAKWLLDAGMDTVCVDFISPEKLRLSQTSYGHHPFRISYQSGVRDPEEAYTELIQAGALQGEVCSLPNGSVEFRDADVWKNDGGRKLERNHFRNPNGKQFAGWNLRAVVDGQTIWYADDGCYRKKADFKSGDIKPYLFTDEATIPVWTVPSSAECVMEAVWAD